jgi:O-antigen ligase
MLKRIAKGNVYFWLAVHVALGVMASVFAMGICVWIYILFLSTIMQLLTTRQFNNSIHYFLCYFLGIEVFTRILKLTPYMPLEAGKYLSIFFLLLGLLFKVNNTGKFKPNKIGLFIVLLSLPSLIMIKENFWESLVFDWAGIAALGLYVMYFSNFIFDKTELNRMLRLIMYPLLTVSVYLLIRTPSLSEMEFSLSANFDASGGFGPNQVASMFGMGIFLATTTLLLNYRPFKERWVEVVLLFLFVFRGLLTSTRGGIFSGVMSIVPVFMFGRVSKASPLRKFTMLVLCGIGAFIVFRYVNVASGNTLAERYEGDTWETSTGYRERNLESITTGRSDLIEQELLIFTEHPFFGVGPGQAAYMWDIDFTNASHTEFTRLLAEHGIFGAVICIILISSMYFVWVRRFRYIKYGYAYYLNLAFLIFSLSMSTHAAMRTMITPFFFGFAYARFKTLKVSQEVQQEAVETYEIAAA